MCEPALLQHTTACLVLTRTDSLYALLMCLLLFCRSLLSALHPAFMQCCNNLHKQLETAISTANERPDTLQTFIAWQAALRTHLQARHTLVVPSSGCTPAFAQGAGRVSACSTDVVRAGLLLEVEALRTLLDVMRWGTWGQPGSAAVVARATGMVDSHSWHMQPVTSHFKLSVQFLPWRTRHCCLNIPTCHAAVGRQRQQAQRQTG